MATTSTCRAPGLGDQKPGVPRIVGGGFNRCSLTDQECGSIGHRLVIFTIEPGRIVDPAAPIVGDPAVGRVVRMVTIAGVCALVAGLVLTAGSGVIGRRGKRKG